MFLLLKMISANCCKWVKYSAIGGFLKGLWKSHRMGHFQILESAGICVLEYKRKPIEMTEFQWVLRNYRIDSGATRTFNLSATNSFLISYRVSKQPCKYFNIVLSSAFCPTMRLSFPLYAAKIIILF